MRPIIKITRFLGRKPKDRAEYQRVWKYLKGKELWKINKLEYDRAYHKARYKSKKSQNIVSQGEYMQFLQLRGLDFEL